MKKGILYIAFIFVAMSAFAQVPPQYSQYIFNQLAINPAYAGSHEVLRASLAFRRQWTGLVGAPQTINFGVDTDLGEEHNNIGIQFINDRTGFQFKNTIGLIYAYRFQALGGKLAFGLQGGLSMDQIKYTRAHTFTADDPQFQKDSPMLVAPHFGAGMWYEHKNFYLGFSVPEIFEYHSSNYSEFISDSVDYRYYFTTIGGLIPLHPDVKFKPSILIKYMPGPEIQFDFNASIIFREILQIGVGYRTEDAIIFTAQVEPIQQLRIGYAFDQRITKQVKGLGTSHEIFLSYRFGYKINTAPYRYF